MRIIFLLNKDVHSLKALNLMRETLKDHNVISIIISNKVGKGISNPKLLVLKKYEQEYLEEISAELESSNKKGKFLTFNQIAKSLNCKIQSFDSINSPDSLKKIQDLNPDLIISIRYGQILQNEIVKIPKLGIINLHSGILPKYRGVIATFWAILCGENEIGTTLHYIDDNKIDEGRIISISRQPLLKNHSLIHNVSAVYDQGCEMIKDFLKNQHIKHDDNDTQEGQYFTYPSEEDVENFEQSMKLVDEKDVQEIYANFKAHS